MKSSVQSTVQRTTKHHKQRMETGCCSTHFVRLTKKMATWRGVCNAYGPSWVLKGRLNESHYTFCKPAFFSSLLSCATTSNNQDKGHLPLWTPFSHSGTSSWIVYRYRSHGSCCTKHKGWLQTSFPFLHQRCCSPLPWHQLLRCRLQGFSFCWNLSAFSLCFFADVFSLWSYCYHWFAGNSWFSLKETVEYGEWRIPRFNVSGTRHCSFTVTLVFIPINPAVYFTTSMLNIMRELASHPLTSWYTIKIFFEQNLSVITRYSLVHSIFTYQVVMHDCCFIT